VRLKRNIVLFFGAGLMACSSVQTISVQNEEQMAVTKEYENPNRIDSIISPYRTELNQEMKVVIAHATKSFERGKPNGALNNWSTDVVLETAKEIMGDSVRLFCLLNWGGLRNSISAGDVRLEDIFKLMPFDNEIVIVEMPLSSLNEITEYLVTRNGEPIAGAILKNGELTFDENNSSESNTFFIATSDYLMNGGDNMSFFEDRLNEIHTNVLLRDAMIDAAKEQDELIWNDEKRIFLKQ